MAATPTHELYRILTDESDGRVCRDIPEEACDEQPGNFVKHVVSLAATKTGDGLADPKLVLSWLLGALGAPAWQVGLLVPIREAGALLPQLGIAAWIRARPRRKWVWALASAGQGTAVLGMAVAAAVLDGMAAGYAILGCLAVFALFRSAASVSYKDVLGKTVSKSSRGTATGTAGSVASSLVLLFGVLVTVGLLPRSVETVTGALAVAGLLWLVAGSVFVTLREAAGATEGAGRPIEVVREQFGLLVEDPQLTRFILVRGLLLATALAPPFLLTLAGARSSGLGDFGPFVAASSTAAVVSAYVWGRLADGSSRQVLVRASLLAAAPLALVSALAWTGGDVLAGPGVLPGLLFVLMVAYQGVRVGRSTHIVDMADERTRAAYVALSNTAVGLLLLMGSGFGVLAQAAGEAAVLAVFAAMCLGASVLAVGLEDVQAA